MPTSDILATLALVVSIFSFAVSLITFYFQFLKKTQIIKVTLLDWFPKNISNTESILVLDLAIVNLGNQSVILSKVGLVLERNTENRVIIPARDKDNPLILDPSDIRKETYEFVCSENQFLFVLDGDSSRREIISAIHFEIIDSNGKHYEKDIYGCIIKAENFRACGTSCLSNVQVTLLP